MPGANTTVEDTLQELAYILKCKVCNLVPTIKVLRAYMAEQVKEIERFEKEPGYLGSLQMPACIARILNGDSK